MSHIPKASRGHGQDVDPAIGLSRVCRGPGSSISLFLLWVGFASAQSEVSPLFETGVEEGANVDSCAVWVAPNPVDSLLFVTEKDGDRIQVWRAHTGEPHTPKPFLGGPEDSTEPGEFDRPNGVWVIYHVPHGGHEFADILLVTDQTNERVQVFRLPELDYFGEFGVGEIGKGYGIHWYQDGTDFFVYITDQEPPDEHPGKIKKYRLRPGGAGLSADLVEAFGSEDGDPPLPRVESILADYALDRLHVCGDEGGDFNLLFRIDGTFTGTRYGEGVFQADQEGINLYETGERSGYLLVSDQRRSEPNEYEIFDRRTLASLGHFRSPRGGPIVTENTDGCFLEQRPLPGFPNGAFFAVHDDANVHVYDWTDVAAALDLELVGLNRPFAGAPASGPADGQRAHPALWFHDGSWWSVDRGSEGRITIRRAEDGTFEVQDLLDAGGWPQAWARDDELVVYVARSDDFSALRRFRYESSRRRYVADGEEIGVGAIGLSSTFAREDEGGRGWLAWIENGILCVAASDGGTLDAWNPELVQLGATGELRPAFVARDGSLGILWAGPDGIVFRQHRDEDRPGLWSAPETAHPEAATSVAALRNGDEVLAAAVVEGRSIWIGRRAATGEWSARSVAAGDARPVEVALALDSLGEGLHLHALVDLSGRLLLERRESGLANLVFDAEPERRGHPGVSFHSLLVPLSVPAATPEILSLALGDDARAYPYRTELSARPDVSAPITLQHLPPPGSEDVEGGTTLSFRVMDSGTGVDRTTLRLLVDGAEAAVDIRGVPTNVLVSHRLPDALPEILRIRIEARDLAEPPHVMTPFEYELRISESTRDVVFRRGDANEDGSLDVSDPVKILFRLFAGSPPPRCDDSQDANDDGAVDISDALVLLRYLFLRGPELPAPGRGCGPDSSEDALACDASAPPCR